LATPEAIKTSAVGVVATGDRVVVELRPVRLDGQAEGRPAELGRGGDAVQDERRLHERGNEVGEDEVVGRVLELGLGRDVPLPEGLVEPLRPAPELVERDPSQGEGLADDAAERLQAPLGQGDQGACGRGDRDAVQAHVVGRGPAAGDDDARDAAARGVRDGDLGRRLLVVGHQPPQGGARVVAQNAARGLRGGEA
jgi:hypothetical protein